MCVEWVKIILKETQQQVATIAIHRSISVVFVSCWMVRNFMNESKYSFCRDSQTPNIRSQASNPSDRLMFAMMFTCSYILSYICRSAVAVLYVGKYLILLFLKPRSFALDRF